MAPPRRGLRIAVIAFTTCSIGLVVALLVHRSKQDDEVVQLSPATVAQPQTSISADPKPGLEPREDEIKVAEEEEVEPLEFEEEESTPTAKPAPQEEAAPKPAPAPTAPVKTEVPAPAEDPKTAPDAGSSEKKEPVKQTKPSSGLLGVESKRSNLLPVTK